jgi:serine/threonine protein kinase
VIKKRKLATGKAADADLPAPSNTAPGATANENYLPCAVANKRAAKDVAGQAGQGSSLLRSPTSTIAVDEVQRDRLARVPVAAVAETAAGAGKQQQAGQLAGEWRTGVCGRKGGKTLAVDASLQQGVPMRPGRENDAWYAKLPLSGERRWIDFVGENGLPTMEGCLVEFLGLPNMEGGMSFVYKGRVLKVVATAGSSTSCVQEGQYTAVKIINLSSTVAGWNGPMVTTAMRNEAKCLKRVSSCSSTVKYFGSGGLDLCQASAEADAAAEEAHAAAAAKAAAVAAAAKAAAAAAVKRRRTEQGLAEGGVIEVKDSGDEGGRVGAEADEEQGGLEEDEEEEEYEDEEEDETEAMMVSCIVMEWVEGRSLLDNLLGTLDAATSADQNQQLVLALADVHAKGVCHRDIKHQNILLIGGEASVGKSALKIIDFGLSVLITQVSSWGEEGTWGMRAPEVVGDRLQTVAVDTWGVGVVLLLARVGMPEGRALEETTSQADVEQLLQKLFDSLPEASKVQEEEKRFLQLCLTWDAGMRPTCQELLQHPIALSYWGS